jgi:hypothetical protein
MQINDDDYKKLEELEVSMWKSETRFDHEYMNNTLTPDFFEFGRSGRVYKKEETLGATFQEINVTLPLKHFSIHSIDANVALVTYISEVQYENLEIANRSSLWIKSDTGWKLRFHQGTPTQGK